MGTLKYKEDDIQAIYKAVRCIEKLNAELRSGKLTQYLQEIIELIDGGKNGN